MTSITKAKNLSGKVVLVRVDFNVPIKKKKVLDDTRLVASLPTIQYLMEKGAKVVLMTHIGRPDGKIVASLKVDPVVERLSELLKKKVKKLETKNLKLSDAQKLSLLKDIRMKKKILERLAKNSLH
ncbi:MAG: Phosphoglycerate kinase [Candidatus Magasanikbacteria bacterium GW2011_GWE2_42_7]|uniref:Phosphoglycerate kinase n=1 Tax=Candidatus Magasanikbacteria bacterium GW2011_GWE2_42_7 TaxID=1619052 RepID=A0A0G1EDY0_9BACT|nr:MAG: Phosphoglycerate kinase [Candidatus Magasanikbacteria bacterium GW2011_GWE2_42_7]